MICPNEKIEMRKVKAESHYGQQLILDQCSQCGGIWFDAFELYTPKPGEAAKIELLDAGNLRDFSAIENAELVCPKDQAKLVRFSDPYFPQEIIIERCPICNGFWLNRGEFLKYQKFRQEKWARREKSAADLKLQEEVSQLLSEHKTGNNTDALGRLGKFLSTPLDSFTWRPLEPERLSREEESVLNLILNAVTIILRFFIRL